MRQRIQHRPAVPKLHVHRVVRRNGRQLGLRGPAILFELLHVPPTRDDEPRARLHRARRGADSSERFFERARADPIDLGAEAQCRANGVEVRIDQTRE